MHPALPGRAYQQNHWGTYVSDDWGDTWKGIDRGLPTDFGFGLALDPTDPETCFVTPLEPREGTFRATTGALQVFRFGGRPGRWKSTSKGLPSSGAYLSVLREGMASDGMKRCGLYVGTGGGHLFHSVDAGRSWKVMAQYLPQILSITAVVA